MEILNKYKFLFAHLFLIMQPISWAQSTVVPGLLEALKIQFSGRQHSYFPTYHTSFALFAAWGSMLSEKAWE